MEGGKILGKPAVPEGELVEYSISTLAWVGDAVFELYIRTRLSSECKTASGPLHQLATHYVSARGQAELAGKLTGEAGTFPLEPHEDKLLRRARNYHSSSMSRNALPADYRKATALEALIGWLWLAGKEDRVVELIDYLLDTSRTDGPDHGSGC